MYNSLAKSLIIPPLIESNDAVMLALIWTPGILVRISDRVAFLTPNKKNPEFLITFTM